MSTTPRIISEVPVTYGEMIEVLTKLGYHQEFDGKNNRYVNEKYDSYVLLSTKLPEQILEILLNHYQLHSQKSPLSKQQLRQVFKEHTGKKTNDKILIDKYLCLLLLGIVITERWISLKKNK